MLRIRERGGRRHDHMLEQCFNVATVVLSTCTLGMLSGIPCGGV
jgi:hypothetical protein